MIHFICEKGKRVRRVFDRARMSPAARQVLEIQEFAGARIANRFRYVFVLVIALPVAWTALDVGLALGLAINLGALGFYLAVTIGHTLVLRRAPEGPRRAFDFLAIGCDYLVLLGAILSWTWTLSPDNFAFALKNTAMVYMLFPIMLSAFQFRPALTLAALAAYLAIFAGLLAYGLHGGVPLTSDWREYLLGPALVLPDMFTRPVLFSCLAITLVYSIYRAVYMIQRIGHVEAEKHSLSRYFSPQVVEEITAASRAVGPARATVEGRRQAVTVLFSDVRGFTRLSEGLDPHALVELLSELRKRQTRIIFEHGGTLDKFIGDAVMATFGTPQAALEPGRDCKNALLAGQALLRETVAWNVERAREGLPPVEIGVGLHAGEVFVGNVGFEGRLEYTVIGDAVNTASRIESLCKYFRWPFVISRAVRDATEGLLPVEALPLVRVKGKSAPLETFRVLW